MTWISLEVGESLLLCSAEHPSVRGEKQRERQADNQTDKRLKESWRRMKTETLILLFIIL